MLLILLAAVAVAMFIQQRDVLFADRGRLQVVQEDGAGGPVVLEWRGDIELPMATRFDEAFREWGGKTHRFVIQLTSRGGSLYEGRQVIELIDRVKRNHQVDTYVGADGYCLSMCVPIYLQGMRRTAASSSRFMFHQPYRADFLTGEKSREPQSERRAMVERYFERYFETADINPAWRDELRREWQDKDVWRTGAELVADRSGVVQALK